MKWDKKLGDRLLVCLISKGYLGRVAVGFWDKSKLK